MITIAEVGAGVAFLVALISGISFLIGKLKKWMSILFDKEFTAMKNELSSIRSDLRDVDMEGCKNYLVRFLSDVEKGDEIDEIEKERFWEQYEHYSSHGGNGYIHRKVDKLKEAKLL